MKNNEIKFPDKRSFLIYPLVFINGMVIMGVELSASRLVAPWFGTTIVVWTNLIGAIMLFLAVGYWLGGLLSLKNPKPKLLYSLTLAAGLIVGLLPLAAKPVMSLVAGADAPATFFAVMAATFVLLAPSTVLMGCVIPIAVRLRCGGAEDSGRTAGALYAAATAGSIIGVFLPVLVLIPTFGTRASFLILSAAEVGVSLAGLAMPSALLLLLVLTPAVLTFGAPLSRPRPGAEIVAVRETLYNHIAITREAGRLMMSVNDGSISYSTFTPGRSLSGTYRDFFALAPLYSASAARKGFPARILILGIGAGIDSRVIRGVYPGVEITGVEIDPGVIDLGEKYMDFDPRSERVVIDDGRRYLSRCEGKFDVIVVDVYKQTYIPFHMATREFFREARECLATDGVLAMNVAWRRSDNHTLLTHVANTVADVFPSLHIASMRARMNAILFASNAETPTKTVLENIRLTGNPLQKEVLAEAAEPAYPFKKVEGHMPFTDDWAPVETLTDKVWYAMTWDD